MESELISSDCESILDDTGQSLMTGGVQTDMEDSNNINCSACTSIGDGSHICNVICSKSSFVEEISSDHLEQSSVNHRVEPHCTVLPNISEEGDVNQCGSSVKEFTAIKESPQIKPEILVDFVDHVVEDVNYKCVKADEDLEPLLTVDDTESQSSDLLSLETVSYDIIPVIGGDDDEKSIGSVSSFSCDMKLDSSQRQSKVSNSSSLINLLDSSIREISLIDGEPSDTNKSDNTGSSASSCVSSPSKRSPKLVALEDQSELLGKSESSLYTAESLSPSRLQLTLIAKGVVEDCITKALDEVLKIKMDASSKDCYTLPEAVPSFSSSLDDVSKPSASLPEPSVASLSSDFMHPLVLSTAEFSGSALGIQSYASLDSALTNKTLTSAKPRNALFNNEGISSPLSSDENSLVEDLNLLLSETPSRGSSPSQPLTCPLIASHCEKFSNSHDPISTFKAVNPFELEGTCESNVFPVVKESSKEADSRVLVLNSIDREVTGVFEPSMLNSHEIFHEEETISINVTDFKNTDSVIITTNNGAFPISSGSLALSSDFLHAEKIQQSCVPKMDVEDISDSEIKDAVSPHSAKQPRKRPQLNLFIKGHSNVDIAECWANSFVDEILATASSKVESQGSLPETVSPLVPMRNPEIRDVASTFVDQILCSAVSQVSETLRLNHLKEEGEPILGSFDTSEVPVACVNVETKKTLTLIDDEKSEGLCDALCQETMPCSVTKDSDLETPSSDCLVSVNVLESLVCEESYADMQDHRLDSSPSESKSTSPECPTTSNSTCCSLYNSTDSAVQKEASLFVDGVIKMAVEHYEDETSSSESSPTRKKRPDFDIVFPLEEEEELATPCGEMVTEHFMDFESGRNASVFCSSENSCVSSCDQLSPFDRIYNTIGNREVDSDTGKSVSVFRSEEDIFYEIQRASTCTSVFESVEEEDEDINDLTVLDENHVNMKQFNKNTSDLENNSVSCTNVHADKDTDAFEDAVDAFLEKERLARDEFRIASCSTKDTEEYSTIEERDLLHKSELRNRHENDPKRYERNISQLVLTGQSDSELSSTEEKRLMAERWANGVPDTPEMREKQEAIRAALDSEIDVASKLCKLALTEGGLINDDLRREAWPRMLGLDPLLEVSSPSLDEIVSHPEYEQVVLDVNRSLKRFPPDIPREQRENLQEKLTRLIMFVISKHPHLRYYQGYHDVAVTFLLVVGEAAALQIMERLSTEHLSDCMQPTMERTSYLLHFIYPLIHRLHPTLAEYLERSEVGTMFCLPWFLTWFGHSLNRYQDVVRLYDHFLASPPLAPLYLAAVLVAHRAEEVLAVDCDMAAIHALLSNIPDTLPLEILLRDATDLYHRYPPESIEKEVEERFKNEQDSRLHEVEARERRRQQRAVQRRLGSDRGSGSWQFAELQQHVGPAMMLVNRWIPPWVAQQQRLSMHLLFASATFFVGFYVYARGDVFP